ncbi:MAG TPA: hypothetical protein ENN67_05110 [Firmicutes bacterium]|nr:hypothetical protein [Bacillota bacterium]
MNRKDITAVRFAGIPLLIMLVAIFAVSCSEQELIVRTSQSDTTPPVFENLNFPSEGIVSSEGLFITGTLTDETAFHTEAPITIEIHTLGASENIVSTRTIRIQGGPYWQEYDTHFDNQTGNFQIKFDTRSRVKPGLKHIRLIGMDAAENTASEEAKIYFEPPDGIDMDDLYDSRTNYGSNMIQFLSSYAELLQYYPNDYAYDIAVLQRIIQYFQQAYIQSPMMDTWPALFEDLMDDVRAIPNQSNPTLKQFIDYTVLPEYLEWLEEEVEQAEYPIYKSPDNETILQYWNLHLARLNGFTALCESQTVMEGEEEITTCRFRLSGMPSWTKNPESVEEYCDFTLKAGTSSELEYDGYIGPEPYRHEIDSQFFDTPLGFFSYLELTGLDFEILLF